MKKIIILLVLTIIIFFSIKTMAVKNNNTHLKFAINLAIKQNLDLKIKKLNLKKAKVEYKKQKANNLLNHSHYSELKAEYSLATARNTYQNIYDNLIRNIIKDYTDIWLSEVNLKIKKKKVKLEKLLLDKAQAQYDIGDIGNINLLEQENAYKDALFNLQAAGDNYKQSKREFRTLVGFENNKLIIIDLKYPQVREIKEKMVVDKALANNIELKLKQEKLKLAGIDRKRSEVSASKLDREIKNISYKVAILEKDNTKEEIINSTREIYYEYKQAIKNMKLKKERLTEACEKYELRRKQYEAGLITKIDLLQYEVNMLETRYQYRSAISSYYLQQHSLRQAMNLKTGVIVNEVHKQE